MPGILVRGVSEATARALRLQAKYEGVSVADLAREARGKGRIVEAL